MKINKRHRILGLIAISLLLVAGGCKDEGGNDSSTSRAKQVAGDQPQDANAATTDQSADDAGEAETAVSSDEADAGPADDRASDDEAGTVADVDSDDGATDDSDAERSADTSTDQSDDPAKPDASAIAEADSTTDGTADSTPLPEIEIPELDIEAALADLPYKDAQDLVDEIKRAYDSIETYQAEISLGIVQKVGRWDQIQRGDLHVAFDRKTNRFMVDKPDLRLVVKDNRMYLKSYKIEGRHMDAPAPDPLSYVDFVVQTPHVATPHLPDMLFFLADAPIKHMVNMQPREMELLPPDFDDPQKRPGLLVKNYMGTWTLRVDPKTHLITSAVYGGPELGEEYFKVQKWHEFEVHIKVLNRPLPTDAFDMPLADSKAVPTWRDLVTGASLLNPEDFAEPKPQKNEALGNHPLAGEAAPPFNLEALEGEAFGLPDAGDEPVVLIFWSSWDGKSKAGLAAIDAIAQEAKANGTSVRFYAINVRESVEDVNRFLKKNKLTIPILMDSDAGVAEAYEVAGMPQIMVIRSGRILYANRGVADGMAETIKGLLAPVAEEEESGDDGATE